MRTIKSVADYKQSAESFEKVNNRVSLTVPEMGTSLKVMLKKAQMGYPLEYRKGNYEEEPEFEHINPLRSGSFDLTDLVELKNEIELIDANLKAARDAIEAEEASKETSTDDATK